MRDLWPFKAWKYFINLTGQEFPLRTNSELVDILTAFGGANSLEGTRKRSGCLPPHITHIETHRHRDRHT